MGRGAVRVKRVGGWATNNATSHVHVSSSSSVPQMHPPRPRGVVSAAFKKKQKRHTRSHKTRVRESMPPRPRCCNKLPWAGHCTTTALVVSWSYLLPQRLAGIVLAHATACTSGGRLEQRSRGTEGVLHKVPLLQVLALVFHEPHWTTRRVLGGVVVVGIVSVLQPAVRLRMTSGVNNRRTTPTPCVKHQPNKQGVLKGNAKRTSYSPMAAEPMNDAPSSQFE